jgi:lysozyme family protein
MQNSVMHLDLHHYKLFKNRCTLTPKGRSPFFSPFLRFGQAIVDAIFVQKISNFWRTCGLVLALRRTNFYKIPNPSLGAMPQKKIF